MRKKREAKKASTREQLFDVGLKLSTVQMAVESIKVLLDRVEEICGAGDHEPYFFALQTVSKRTAEALGAATDTLEETRRALPDAVAGNG